MNFSSRLTFVFLIIPFLLFSQKESNNWYFGIGAGITFNPNNSPSSLTNSVISSGKGTATISDSCTGQLYFYTNGDSIINRNHQIMQNGNNLDGSSGSTQSAIIVPSPDASTGDYFVFTIERTKGLKYSVVNMSLASGLGAVVPNRKNIALVSQTVEKVTAVRHRNNKDVWIITHTSNSDEFYAFQLTSSGVVATPIISTVGNVYGSGSVLGYMKASPRGDKLAMALTGDQKFELFDFDNLSGIVSNPRSSGNHYSFAYGVEFSPDGGKLYVTSNLGLYQYDLNSALPGIPLGDSTFIGNKPTVAIQLGPNGLIYCNEGFSLGVINDPNKAGVACNYMANSVSLSNRFASSGLPTFMQSYFSLMFIVSEGICFGITTQFNLSTNRPLDSIAWNFGEPSSGVENTSILINPKHKYNDTGQFTIRVLVYSQKCGITRIDTVEKTIEIVDLPIPKIDLGNDTAICKEDSILLWTDGLEPSYIWSTGSKQSQIYVKSQGNYWVNSSNSCGSLTDSINLSLFNSTLNLDLGDDTLLCEGEFLRLDAKQNDATYLWNNGSEFSELFVKKSGEYWVEVSDICYSKSDTFIVGLKIKPVVNLGNDTIICEGTTLALDASFPNSVYLWNNKSELPSASIFEEGSYRVRVTNDCGSVSGDIYVRTKNCTCNVFIPNSITPNNDGLNDALIVANDCEFKAYRFEIYNRWGEIIFLTTSPSVSWDGIEKSGLPALGTYYYLLTYISTDPFDTDEYQLRGMVNVIK